LRETSRPWESAARREARQGLIAGQFIPQQQLDNDIAAELEAEANVGSARANLARRSSTTGGRRSTSPLSGIAGIAQLQVGSLVSTSTVMTTVSQVDPIKAEFNVSAARIYDIGQGQSVGPATQGDDPVLELILEDDSTYPHPGGVVAINRQVDRRTGTIGVVGSFPNPGNLLRPGQYGKIRAAVDVRKGALLVPVRASTDPGVVPVGVVDGDGKVDVRNVQCGQQVANELIVERGLQAGEKVIVEDSLAFGRACGSARNPPRSDRRIPRPRCLERRAVSHVPFLRPAPDRGDGDRDPDGDRRWGRDARLPVSQYPDIVPRRSR